MNKYLEKIAATRLATEVNSRIQDKSGFAVGGNNVAKAFGGIQQNKKVNPFKGRLIAEQQANHISSKSLNKMVGGEGVDPLKKDIKQRLAEHKNSKAKGNTVVSRVAEPLGTREFGDLKKVTRNSPLRLDNKPNVDRGNASVVETALKAQREGQRANLDTGMSGPKGGDATKAKLSTTSVPTGSSSSLLDKAKGFLKTTKGKVIAGAGGVAALGLGAHAMSGKKQQEFQPSYY